MNKIFFTLSIPFVFLLANETSMFGAGDLESPSPYGLTSAEKVIVKNKNTLAENKRKIKNVDVTIQNISDRLDGLESLIEGDSQKLNKVSINLKKEITKTDESFKSIESDKAKYRDNLKKISQEFIDLKSKIDVNSENISSLKSSFDEIVTIVNDINKNYISKSQFDKLITLLDKDTTAKVKKTSNKNRVNKSKSDKQLMADVRVYFKKDYFTKALPILDYLISKSYRPAECNYYKGEIKYYRKIYKDALHYFKKSMMLYDKAKYLPKLLLHSAISFEKTGDTANAENFYTTLVEVYPESKEAKIASEKIK